MVDADEAINRFENKNAKIRDLAQDIVDWFIERQGEVFTRRNAVQIVSEEFNIDSSTANRVISSLVGDIVDPVQQISDPDEKYVGVIKYTIFDSHGAYGYIDYDDLRGKRKRVVCARCVEQHAYDGDIAHATQGEGTSSPDDVWNDLLEKIAKHYSDYHSKDSTDVKPGASLVDGTTISGNTAFHAGNDGQGSGLTPDSHGGSHGSGGNDELNVENLGTTGGSGEVPVSNGSGNLSMQSPPSRLTQIIDDAQDSVQTSYNFDFSGNQFDYMEIYVDIQNGDVVSNPLDLRHDNETSGYVYWTNEGSIVTGASAIPLAQNDWASLNNYKAKIEVINTSFGGGPYFTINGAAETPDNTVAAKGVGTGLDSTSIQFLSNEINIDIAAYGFNFA